MLIGGTENNSSIGTISTSTECNFDESQGWYYLSTINSAEYHSISLSIVVAGGRVCESLLGCSCTMYLSTFVTFNSVCTQCDYSICDAHKSQAPVLLITAILLNPPTLAPIYSPTVVPTHPEPTLEPTISPTQAETHFPTADPTIATTLTPTLVTFSPTTIRSVRACCHRHPAGAPNT